MVASIQNYTVANRQVAIDVTTVPVLSDKTIDVLEKFKIPLPQAFRNSADLKERVESAAGWSVSLKLQRIAQILVGGFVYSELLAEFRRDKSMYLLPTLEAVKNSAAPIFAQLATLCPELSLSEINWSIFEQQDHLQNALWATLAWTSFSLIQMLTDSCRQRRALNKDLEEDRKINQSWIEFDRERILADAPDAVGHLRKLAQDLQTLKSLNASGLKDALYEQDRKDLLQAADEIDQLYLFYRKLTPSSRADAA